MTRASLREYAAVQRERYQQATRADKHRLLEELVAVTGLHRKAAIRLLRRPPRSGPTPWPERLLPRSATGLLPVEVTRNLPTDQAACHP